MMKCESPFRRFISMESPPLSAVGREAQLSATRSPLRRSTSAMTSLEPPSPPPPRASLAIPVSPSCCSPSAAAIEAQALGLRSPPRRPIAHFARVGHDALHLQHHGPTLDVVNLEPRRSTTVSPCRKLPQIEEPLLTAVGHEAQLVSPSRSPRRRINTASLRDHLLKDKCLRRLQQQQPHSEIQSQNSGPIVGAICDGVFGALPSNPWVLHFSREGVKGSAFDEQVRGQLRTSTRSYKLGHRLESVDVGTFAKLSSASVHDLIKLITNKLQNVKVHKKSCEDLFYYLQMLDDSLLSLFKTPDVAEANLSHGVHRLLGMLKECLADAYVLVKRCESRSPLHPNLVSNVPAKFLAVEGEIRRITPVLRLAIAQHQDNMGRVAFDTASDDLSSAATRRNTTSSSLGSSETKDRTRSCESQVLEELDELAQKSGLDSHSPSRLRTFVPWRLDVHPLKMHRSESQTYLCKACHQVGKGCVVSCSRCNYHVHPGCVELNEAIQQLEEIRINKLSMNDDCMNSDRNLCGLTR
ncbi:hypothetical protein MPTK1_1g03450 [Marchantia polymorpha subsp. ruderalis]|uniref:Phorbol-ester/DAG-type domain-containing protein n=2 Tax=Marchantia polymorpha TaxID=3197 RepID=A0A176WKN3_MARPO|nr:hypothetical protein AXG93_4773s1550 [Marchantia polymorpha subsp. ruderalis]PTQ48645.1 hypothetical protein MARPO_0005s0262 [Marchantia polymorpha]BBM97160.1 hypothetical protein Mp_1g03450 [Marchantia polymorpha subsp. ruderalis]|eukprot:PTQ48645.1 hypothetical protein MARPO_0005s0262 [Marchantia polymorpha]